MNKKQEIIKLIKFNIIGVVNTIIDFAVYGVLRQSFGVVYPVAAAIGYGCGLINSYIFNRRWTFNKKDGDVKTVLKFLLVNLISFVTSLLILTCFEQLHFNESTLQILIAKGVATIVSLLINFAGSRLWVFK